MNNYIIVKNSLNNKLLNKIVPEFKNFLKAKKILPDTATESDAFNFLRLMKQGLTFRVNLNSYNEFSDYDMIDPFYGYTYMRMYVPVSFVELFPSNMDFTIQTISIDYSERYTWPEEIEWTEADIQYNGYKYVTAAVLEVPIAPYNDLRSLFLYQPAQIPEVSFHNFDQTIMNNSPDNYSPNIRFLISYVALGGKLNINFIYYGTPYMIFEARTAQHFYGKYVGLGANIEGILKATESNAFRYAGFAI